MAAARNTTRVRDVAALLREATAGVESAHGEEALNSLRRAWERARIERLGDAMGALSAKLLGEPLPAISNSQKRYLAWCERAKAKRPVDVGPLLEALTGELESDRPRNHLIRGRYKMLWAFEPDPRIGHFAVGLLKTVSAQRALLLMARKHIDPAQDLSPLEIEYVQLALAEVQIRQQSKVHPAQLEAQLALLDEAIERAAPMRVAAPALEAPGVESEAALLSAVYANPQDNGLRQIYGDRLIERSDPRGELIALQFQRAAKTLGLEGEKRELSLLKKYRTKWLGALEPFVVKSRAHFEKGFAAKVDCNVRRIFLARQAFALAEWATVREIRFDDIAFITPAMRSLEIAVNVGPFGIQTLLELEVMPALKGLTLHPSSAQCAGPLDEWPFMRVLARLTMLKSLVLVMPWHEVRHVSVVELMHALSRKLPASVTDLSLMRLRGGSADTMQRNRTIQEAIVHAPPHTRRMEIEGMPYEKYEGEWERSHRRTWP